MNKIFSLFMPLAFLALLSCTGLGGENKIPEGLEGKALELYPKAAAGDPDAQTELARCYVNGIGCKIDSAEAINWTKKAAEQGNSAASATVGSWYDLEKNEALANEWYKKAYDQAKPLAEQGNALSMYTLGCLYAMGRVVAQDDEKALSYWKKGAELGDTHCMLKLCSYFTIIQDYSSVIKYTQDAVAKGDVVAIYNLGKYYYDGIGVNQDYSMAVKYFKDAQAKGLAQAKNDLAMCYMEGKGVRQNYDKAVQLFQEAINQGFLAAKNNLGMCYLRGGVEKDFESAVKLFKEVIGQSEGDPLLNSMAKQNLGACYENGEGLAQDYAMAFKLYQEAVDQGNIGAKNNLGVCYLNGKGVERDYAQAVKLFQEAANQGDAMAIYNLGTCYEFGQGVPLSLFTAIKLYKLSASMDCVEAKNALQDLHQKYGLN